MKDGRSTVDAVVSLTGFSLVGGPAYNDSKAAEEILARLDVPYLSAHPVEFQTLEQWGASDRGLMPVESTIMVAIPELDGAAGPMVYGGRSDGAGIACTGCERACMFCPLRDRRRDACLQRARRHAGVADRAAGRDAPRRAPGSQGRDRAVQFPAQCRQYRHRGVSLGVRVAASDAERDEARGLSGRCSRRRRCAARADRRRQCRALRRRCQCSRPNSGRRSCSRRKMAASDRGAMGAGARQATERRQFDFRARRALRKCLRRHSARLRLRRRSDAAAVREGLCADACLLGVLSLAARGFRRQRGAALRHPWRARIHAGQAGRPVRRVLAGSHDRRSAEHLSLCVEQSVRRHHRQAPLGGDA